MEVNLRYKNETKFERKINDACLKYQKNVYLCTPFLNI